MKKTMMALAATMAATTAVPAAAQTDQGSIQVKAFVTAVLPDGSITDVNVNRVGAPAGSDSRADDNYTPTVAVEYFISPNFSIETIAGVTQHDVTGAGALAGARLVSNANIIPATVTAKLHLDTGTGIKPYIGAGPSYFLIFGEDVDASARALGATRVDLSDEFGFALQAGVDVQLNDSGLGLTVDAKRYFMGTTASFFAGNTLALQTEHDLDPWVVSAGLSWRF
ncbi:MAG: outer membrane beta-barrel protein [Sphingopyxis sp.]|nr:outer membrane beta-barrel protein [Sphingopyxis sp.]